MMETLLAIIYMMWAVYSGYKVVSGRNEWLDSKAPASIVVKMVLSIAIGTLIGSIYLIYYLLKFFNIIEKEF